MNSYTEIRLLRVDAQPYDGFLGMQRLNLSTALSFAFGPISASRIASPSILMDSSMLSCPRVAGRRLFLRRQMQTRLDRSSWVIYHKSSQRRGLAHERLLGRCP